MDGFNNFFIINVLREVTLIFILYLKWISNIIILKNLTFISFGDYYFIFN